MKYHSCAKGKGKPMSDHSVAVTIDGRSLTCCDVAELASRPVRASLSDSAWHAIGASHQAALTAVAHRPVYGRSTGVGANKGIDVGNWPEYAMGLLRSHATSAGEFRSAWRVRAMLLVRLNQLASGGAGISPAAAGALEKMINADALPAIREFAGIGTGDLSALATTALGLLGEIPLTRPLPPVEFGIHDALPFLSSNAATLGDVAIAGHRLQNLARSAITVATLTMVAVQGNLEAFAPEVARSTPGAGSNEVCRTVRGLTQPAPPLGVRIQDPFAIRCLPQVNGSMLDALQHLEATGDELLNVAAENPMILPGAGSQPGVSSGPELVVHHGGFHLPGLALACDGAAIAVAQSGPLLLSRLALLIDPAFTGLPAFLGEGRPGASGVMLLEFVAGSALAVLRSAAVPASLGTVSISRGAEEDASFASYAAAQLFEVASAYSIALACELVAAVRAVRMSAIPIPAGGWGAAMEVCARLPADLSDRDLTSDVAQAQELLPALGDLAVRSALPV
jgi:histidine ammonia-lyase